MTAIDGTPDLLATLNAVDGGVREQLGELLDALDSEGGRYGRDYAEWLLAGRGRGGPKAPPALQGPAGKLIRELVLDEATAVQLYGSRR